MLHRARISLSRLSGMPTHPMLRRERRIFKSMGMFLDSVCTSSYRLIYMNFVSQTSALQTLHPPIHTCTSGDVCSHSRRKLLLTKAEQGEAIIYLLNDGAVLAYHVHLKCEGAHGLGLPHCYSLSLYLWLCQNAM